MLFLCFFNIDHEVISNLREMVQLIATNLVTSIQATFIEELNTLSFMKLFMPDIKNKDISHHLSVWGSSTQISYVFRYEREGASFPHTLHES